MSLWWYVEIALLLGGPTFLWWARPRFPSRWTLFNRRMSAELLAFQRAMLEFAQAGQKVSLHMGRFAGKIKASEGTHNRS